MSDNIVVSVAVPSWANDAFIASILRRDEDDASLTLTSCHLDGTTTVGDNYMSELVRVAVEYTTQNNDGDPSAPKKLRLIIKSLPPGEMMQKWIGEIGAFDREIHMYGVTLPQINRMVRDRTGADGPPPLAPRMLVNERANTVVLEDLTPHGYRMANRREGLDLAHCTQALTTLARLHATSIALHAQDPDTMDFYHEVFYVEHNRKMLADFMETTFDSLAREVGTWEGYERFEETIKKISATSVDRCIKLVKNREGGVRVLNHGDFWTNNMLFRYDDDGKVVDAKMIDFQMGRFASPALDLYYFLYTSPQEHVLETCFDQLVEAYHAALDKTLCQLDCNENLRVSLAQIKQELEDKLYFAVVMSCMFCIMVADPKDAPELSSLTEENLETFGTSTMSKAFAGKQFRSRLQRRLIKFEKMGLI